MNKTKITNMISEYCTFEKGLVYTLILLPRKKENSQQVEREKLQKRVRFLVANMDDVNSALDEYDRYAKLYPEIVFRIYISVNRRSLLKAMREFQRRLMDIQYDLLNGNEQAWTSVERLGSEWKSTLAKKPCREDRFFHYDIDLSNSDPKEVAIVKNFVHDIKEFTEVKYFGESKNGFALVVFPFNPNLIKLPEGIEMTDDGYLYVDCLNG